MSIIVILIVIIFGIFGAAFDDDPVARSVVVAPECVAATESTEEQADGCGAPENNEWIPVDVGGIQGVIVTESDSPLFTEGEGYWTPTVAEIADTEDAIQHEQGGLDHIRQYVGFIEDGERKIYVNGFCDAFGIDWETVPVMVDDGGDCYFTAVYNVDSEGLEWFTFNGDA
jgi:hypothetical protein